jgi:hypothetical protein
VAEPVVAEPAVAEPAWAWAERSCPVRGVGPAWTYPEAADPEQDAAQAPTASPAAVVPESKWAPAVPRGSADTTHAGDRARSIASRTASTPVSPDQPNYRRNAPAVAVCGRCNTTVETLYGHAADGDYISDGPRWNPHQLFRHSVSIQDPPELAIADYPQFPQVYPQLSGPGMSRTLHLEHTTSAKVWG